MAAKLKRFFLHPRFMLWLHGFSTVAFVVMIPISLFTHLKDSVPYVVFLSLWALVASHWACYLAERSKLEVDSIK